MIKHKSFAYRNEVEWKGGRAGMARARGKPEFRVASPPEFKGEEGVWSPEDLLVEAVNACTMTTFFHFADRAGLQIASYASEAEGTLEFVEGSFRFTRVVVRPVIAVTAGETEAVRAAMVQAHEKCLISNSLRARVTVEPVIEQRPAQGA